MVFFVQPGLCKESQNTKAIVDRDHDHASLGHERCRVVKVAAAAGKSAAMNPNHHGQAARTVLDCVGRVVADWYSLGGRIDIQEQAIFAAKRSRLRALTAECLGLERCLELPESLRRLPA